MNAAFHLHRLLLILRMDTLEVIFSLLSLWGKTLVSFFIVRRESFLCIQSFADPSLETVKFLDQVSQDCASITNLFPSQPPESTYLRILMV